MFGTWFLTIMDVHGDMSLDQVDDAVWVWFLEMGCGAIVGEWCKDFILLTSYR